MKNKFYRYYFLNLQFAIAMVFIQVLITIAPLSALISGDDISGVIFFQICVIATLIPSFLYACLGCYWVFQKVVINSDGIEIFFIKKSIKKVDWNTVSSIRKTNHHKCPSLEIELSNKELIYLDNRKPIIRAIEYYSDIKIEKSAPPPPHFMREYK